MNNLTTILLVDDTPGAIDIVRSTLSGAGCHVVIAINGERALQLAQSVLPNLILLDIRMPGMDGFDVCRRLKADERTRAIPIIFLSALEDERDKVKGFQAGGVDYITKPFQPEEVLARVGTHLRLQKLTTGLEQTVRERTEELTLATSRLEEELAERKRAEKTLYNTNRKLRAISDCNQALLRATDEQALLVEICRIVCDEAGYRMAWVGYAEHDATKSVRPVAWAGVEEGYLAAANITWADTDRGRGPTGAAIRSGTSVCIQDFATDAQSAPWSQKALERGYRSSISLPLKGIDTTPFGALTIYSTEPHAFTPEEVRLMEELAGDLAFGITTLRLRDEHDRAATALRASEEKYRRLVSTANEGVWIVDAEDRVQFANPQLARMFGYGVEDVMGRPVLDFFFEEDFAADERIRQEFRQGLAKHFEQRYRRKDGTVLWAVVSATPIFDEEHRYQGAFGMTTDITERKLAEERLRGAKEAADEANRAKDQFLAVLSHELRTPLTPVLATVTALETQGELSAEIREDLQLIRRNVALETKLIDDLLDFTRLTRGKIQLHYEVVDAHACLEAALQVCQGQIQAKQLTISRHLQAQQHQIWADQARLQQVFWNLLQNAAKFTPEHGTIHLWSRNQDGRIQLQVQDNGIGIEPAMLPRLFDAFVQAEQTKARRFGGLGMGLAIAKSIMDLHQGQLRAFSDGPSQGATFTVELAVLASPPIVAVPPPPVEVPTPRQGQHILLVEDTPDTLKVLTRLLTRWGHQVTPADSVHAALEYAAKERFDLLVSDIGLPDGSGLDIMRQLKQEYGLRGIAVSGYGMDEDVRQSQEAGFEKHLTKPLSFDVLRAAVREVVPT